MSAPSHWTAVRSFRCNRSSGRIRLSARGVTPQRSILRGENGGPLPQGKLLKLVSRRRGNAAQADRCCFAGDGENALRELLPGERETSEIVGTTGTTVDRCRPLNPAKVQEYAACHTCHPEDPPLEPQGGRPHNLFRTTRMDRGTAKRNFVVRATKKRLRAEAVAALAHRQD